MMRGSPEHRFGKELLSARLMVAEALFGTARSLRLVAPNDESAARMMAKFYEQLNQTRKW
jgi:hypothetical protein